MRPILGLSCARSTVLHGCSSAAIASIGHSKHCNFPRKLRCETKALSKGDLDKVGNLVSNLLAQSLAPIQNDLSDLKSNYSTLSTRLGGIMEERLRSSAVDLFGQAYVRPLLVRSLQDAALLIPDNYFGNEPHQGRQALVSKIAEQLLKDNIPLRLLVAIQVCRSICAQRLEQ